MQKGLALGKGSSIIWARSLEIGIGRANVRKMESYGQEKILKKSLA
jgi:hypothetical protein